MINRTKLSNGLVVLSEFVPYVNSFAAGICINAGSANDYPNKSGIAHFMEHSAFKHTRKRSSKQIVNSFENLGADINAFTSQERTQYEVRALSEHFSEIFELISDLSINTVFVDKEIELERLVILEEIKEDDEEDCITDSVYSLVFKETPLATPILGTKQSVLDITPSDLERFHDDFYFPANMIVAVSGNIEHDRIVKLAEKYFEPDYKKTPSHIEISDDREIWKKNISEITTEHSAEQAHVMFGTLSEGWNGPEYYPLDIVNNILGGSCSSRLYQNIREKHGLAYTIYSSINSFRDCGILTIYASISANNVQKTIELIYEEMHKLNSKPPTKKEIDRAKEQLKSLMIIGNENMYSRMQQLIKFEINQIQYEPIYDRISKVENVTIEDILNINNKYFQSDMWCKCIMKPAQDDTKE